MEDIDYSKIDTALEQIDKDLKEFYKAFQKLKEKLNSYNIGS